MIGPSITIKGEISGDEDLLVQGNVEGSIKLKDKALSVGESGQVKADIQAQEVKIEGKVTGDIIGVENVVISKSGGFSTVYSFMITGQRFSNNDRLPCFLFCF